MNPIKLIVPALHRQVPAVLTFFQVGVLFSKENIKVESLFFLLCGGGVVEVTDRMAELKEVLAAVTKLCRAKKFRTFSRLDFNNPLQLINQLMVLAVQLLHSLSSKMINIK